MSTEVLKEFLVAIGVKMDETRLKRASEAIDKVERQLGQNEKADQERAEAEQKRHDQRRRNAQALSFFLGDFAKGAAGAAALVGTAMVAMAESVRRGIQEFDKMYYVSGRTGASVNNLKALGYAFEQTGSSAQAAIGAVESFAKSRRANPGIDAMLRGYGVNTKGDSSEVLMNSIDAISARHPQYTGAQVAELLGISPDEYDHLVRYRKEIAHFTDEYRRMQRALGVEGNETANTAKEIMRQLGRLSAVVEVLADKLTQTFAPAIKTVTDALGGIADWFADEGKVKAALAYFDPIIGAVKTLTGWLKQAYELFVKMFEYVRASPLGKILGAVDPGYIRGKVLEALQPGSAQAATNPEGDTTAGGKEKPGLFRRGLNAIKRGLGIGGHDLEAKPGSKEAIRGKTFEAKAPGIMKRLMADFGLTKDEAAIVLGNLGTESDGFRAFEEYNGGPGRGWAQWTQKDRKRNFFEYAKRNKLDPKSDEANYGFLKWELENTHKHAITRLKKARTTREKMYKFEEAFEGAGVKNYESRFNYARRAREAYDRAEAAPPVAVMPSTPAPRLPSFARPNSGAASPGTFDLDAILRSQPMGATTSNVDNRRNSDVKFGDTHVTIHGNGNPQDTANSFKRAQADLDSLRLRDVTTAIR